ncbi:MAG: radical SAM protein [Candidatus Eremiobacterota bacterium]
MIYESEKLDCLFLHIPKTTEKNSTILIMPMGIIALCDRLFKEGIRAKILNPVISKIENPDFSFIKYLKHTETKIACISLHWHPTSYNVMETVKEIKNHIPSIYTVLGGFTATFFHEEIMKYFPDVDFIIRGDSEIPLSELSETLTGRKNVEFKDIPNLTWREGNNITVNPQSYRINQEIFDNLYYGNLDLIYDRNLNLKGMWTVDNSMTKREAYKAIAFSGNKKYFFYNPGRGCPVNCSFCGGGSTGHNILNGRDCVIYKSHDSVLRDIKGALNFHITNLYICFDPWPSSTDYYIELFEKIKKDNIEININFESWQLPEKSFIDSFKRNLLPDSEIILSPDTGSDRVRKYNKGYYYSTDELIETVDYMHSRSINTSLYFTAGLPGETMEDVYETKTLITYLRKNYNSKIYIFQCETEPLSPMYLYPEKFGIKLKRKSFMDFYNHHNNRTVLGYSTDYFTEDQILELIKMLEKFA